MARRGIAVLFTVLGVAVFLSMAGFALLYLVFGREPPVSSNSTLVLRVGGNLTEIAPNDVVTYVRGVRAPTVRSVVDNLRKAKVDPRVRAVMLKPTGFESPFWGKVQEIRDAVIDFRKSGKPVYAYLEYAGDREYYLATAADKVFRSVGESLAPLISRVPGNQLPSSMRFAASLRDTNSAWNPPEFSIGAPSWPWRRVVLIWPVEPLISGPYICFTAALSPLTSPSTS